MKNLILIAIITVVAFTACTKAQTHNNVSIADNGNQKNTANGTQDKYQIGYGAKLNNSTHDGVVLVSCSMPVGTNEAKLLVQKTILRLENIALDTATMYIIEIKKFDGDPSDVGYRDAGFSCGCDNQRAVKSFVNQ